ncbi:MAG: hypothetical protein ABL870_10370 [Sediminibacterium sp.]
MKKYEQLGKKLTREEQKAVGGGFTQVANVMCLCNGDPPEYSFPVCGSNCSEAYGNCNLACPSGVQAYGNCVLAGACW